MSLSGHFERKGMSDTGFLNPGGLTMRTSRDRNEAGI